VESTVLVQLMRSRRLVIGGASAIAEVAYELFTHDSDYEVAAFTVDRNYIERDELFGLPVIPTEEVADLYPPTDHDAFVALGYGELNRRRTAFFTGMKEKGYVLATYVSSKAFRWHNVAIGENCLIFENNVLQPFVTVGDNVTLWSGNHIGHHSTIRNNVFIASHAVVSGFVDIGDSSFIGVNATIANDLTIGADCLIGAAAIVLRDLEPGSLVAAKATDRRNQTTWERFGVTPRA
jgi:sugar O-acyltransferase (sialic acid O-acetyltransferase NeuD family)